MEKSSIVPTPQQLRALTHPTRLRMLGLLRTEGPATSTTLAQRLGLNTGAASYHLRQLAEHGFIEDDPDRGSGRERWWRTRHSSTYMQREVEGQPVDGDTIDAYLQSVVTVYTDQMQRAIEERATLPEEWRAASTFSDWRLRLTPAGARALLDRLGELVEEIEDEAGPDAGTYTVMLGGFVQPGQVDGNPTLADPS